MAAQEGFELGMKAGPVIGGLVGMLTGIPVGGVGGALLFGLVGAGIGFYAGAFLGGMIGDAIDHWWIFAWLFGIVVGLALLAVMIGSTWGLGQP